MRKGVSVLFDDLIDASSGILIDTSYPFCPKIMLDKMERECIWFAKSLIVKVLGKTVRYDFLEWKLR